MIDDSDSVHDLTDSEDSPTEMGVGELPRNGIGGGVSGRGCNGSAAAGGGHRAHGYTFSDRGDGDAVVSCLLSVCRARLHYLLTTEVVLVLLSLPFVCLLL